MAFSLKIRIVILDFLYKGITRLCHSFLNGLEIVITTIGGILWKIEIGDGRLSM